MTELKGDDVKEITLGDNVNDDIKKQQKSYSHVYSTIVEK